MGRRKQLPTGIYRRNGSPTLWIDFTVKDDRGGSHRFREDAHTDVADLADLQRRRRREQELSRLLGQSDPATYERFIADYLTAAGVHRDHVSCEYDRTKLEDFLGHAGRTWLHEVTADDVRGWQRAKLDAGLARSSIQRYENALRAAFTWAVREKHLERSPFDDVRKIIPKMRKYRIEFLEADQRDELLEACRETRTMQLYEMAAVACFAGLRLSEILWLDLADLDLDAQELWIREKPGWRPKDKEERRVPLPDNLVKVLRRHVDGLRDGPVFRTSRGTRHTRTNVARAMRKAVERTKDVSASFNTLRHTYASHLVMAGMSIFAVSKLLGHASVTTTERNYAELAPNRLVDEVTAVFAGTAKVVPMRGRRSG